MAILSLTALRAVDAATGLVLKVYSSQKNELAKTILAV